MTCMSRRRVALTVSFVGIFTTVYGGASWLSAHRELPTAPHLSWELTLPFVPAAAWIYLSVPAVLLLIPFVAGSRQRLLALWATLTCTVLAAGLCYLLYPVAQAWPERVAHGPWAGLFGFVDAVNLEHNELPSLHVAFATLVALWLGRDLRWVGRGLLGLWLVAVAASTLLLHEHHLLDVTTGAALGALATVTVGRRVDRRDAVEALDIELLCLREVTFFARRHPRYLVTAVAIWTYSLPRWRETRLMRAGFCLAQHLDDVLDGDRPIEGDPVRYARRVLEGEPGVLRPVAVFVSEELSRRGHADERPRAWLDELVELLIRDRRRMDARETWSGAELRVHHRRTFQLSLDLTLVAAGSSLRAGDVPELVDAFAWCSPVRDLREDLDKGLINVPREVLSRVSCDPGSRDFLASGPVRAWLREEHHNGAAAIAACRPRELVLVTFHRALAAFERRYRRRHPDLFHVPLEATG